MKNALVVSDLDILGGTAVFAGTRVPVRILFENLADGASLEEILDAYPTLSRSQVVQVLLQADSLIERTASQRVRVLIDESLPRQLKEMLSAFHDAATVDEQGWKGFKNGALLREANAVFDVLVTADKNMRFRQSFKGLKISLIVLPTNRLRQLRKAVSALLQPLNRAEPGRHIVMEFEEGPLHLGDLKLKRIDAEGGSERHLFVSDAP